MQNRITTSAGAGVIAVFICYLINSGKFNQQPVWISSVVFGLAVSSLAAGLAYLSSDPNTVKKIAALGPRIASSIVAAVTGASSVACSWSGALIGSRVLAALSFVASAMSFFGPKQIAEKVAEIDERVNVKSQHFTWQSDIERTAVHASDSEMRNQLLALSESCRYVSSGSQGSASAVDSDIDSTVEALRSLVVDGANDEAVEAIEKIRRLFAEREVILRNQRR